MEEADGQADHKMSALLSPKLMKSLQSLSGRFSHLAAAVRRVLSAAKDTAIICLPRRVVQILAGNRWQVREDIKDQVAAYRTSSRKGKRKIVLYTAVFGDVDTLLLPDIIDPEIDYICYTDRPRNDYGVWQLRSVPYSHSDRTRIARYVKMHPHRLFPAHEVAAWIDANILLKGDIRKYVELVRGAGAQIGLIAHPDRDCFYEEVEACKRFGKDKAVIIDAQADHYRANGLPHKQPLYETGFMVVQLQDAQAIAALQLWWRQIEQFSRRDQLSLSWVTHQMPELNIVSLLPRGSSVRNHEDFRYYRHSYARALMVPKVVERLGAISAPTNQ